MFGIDISEGSLYNLIKCIKSVLRCVLWIKGDGIIRIVSGARKGVKLIAPAGMDTRPTRERVKEAVFSAVQFQLEGSRVLDLFAGSGQMGIEAASRGAGFVLLNDVAVNAAAVIHRNVEAARLQNCTITCQDYRVALANAKQYGPFDIIFLDPPYGDVMMTESMRQIDAQKLLAENGLIICEESHSYAFADSLCGFYKQKQYRYGSSTIAIYRHDDLRGARK